MANAIKELYSVVDEQISTAPVYQEKLHALAKAKLAILEELGQVTGKDGTALLDVLTSLNEEVEELYRQALFRAALKLGMELGRLPFTK